jgi:hypothetical protein
MESDQPMFERPALDRGLRLKGGVVAPHRLAHHGAFGNDRFGVTAERFARFFGPLVGPGPHGLVPIRHALRPACSPTPLSSGQSRHPLPDRMAGIGSTPLVLSGPKRPALGLGTQLAGDRTGRPAMNRTPSIRRSLC